MVVPQLKFELLVCALTKAVLEAALEDTFNKLEETEEDKYLGQTTLEVCDYSECNVVYIQHKRALFQWNTLRTIQLESLPTNACTF